jgi:hypothetical protein
MAGSAAVLVADTRFCLLGRWGSVAVATLFALPAIAPGCGSNPPQASAPSDKAYWEHSPKTCTADEVREYFCDELLPLESALPAPEPYQNCPASVEGHIGHHQPVPPVAVFDASYTEHIRKRMPPGHSCCYSWCTPLELGDPARSAQTLCNDPRAFRERYCFPELEGGTSQPVGGAYQACPATIVPPSGVAFSRPAAAPFDPASSTERRNQGFKECCYGWCSIAPPGTGLEKPGKTLIPEGDRD